MHVLPGVHGSLIAAGGYGPAITTTYVGQNGSATDATSYTFSSESIGAQQTGRHILVSTHYEVNSGNASVTGVTLAGSAMTEVVKGLVNDGVGDTGAGLWLIKYDNANTTADIVATLDGTASHFGIGVWQLYNGTQIPIQTVATDNSGTDLQATHSGSVTLAAASIVGGSVVFAMTNETHGDVSTPDGDFTERFDASVSTGMQIVGADDAAPTTGAGSYTYSDIVTTNDAFAVMASFR